MRQQHLHGLHPEQLPSPSAVLLAAQGLSVLMPGDVGRGGAPGIAMELQGGAKGEPQLCRLARVLDVGGIYRAPRYGSAVGAQGSGSWGAPLPRIQMPTAGTATNRQVGLGGRVLKMRETTAQMPGTMVSALKPTRTQRGGEGTMTHFFLM